MAVGEKQKLVTEIVAEVLGYTARVETTFPWLKNVHLKENFGNLYPSISRIYSKLGGADISRCNKRICGLRCDAYFGGDLNFIFEFDEAQHFTTARLTTLKGIPNTVKLGFSKQEYIIACNERKQRGDKYRANKTTKDFNFVGGRTAQRAYFDACRDLLSSVNGLRPTVRIAEFEVEAVKNNDTESRKLVKKLLEQRIERQI